MREKDWKFEYVVNLSFVIYWYARVKIHSKASVLSRPPHPPPLFTLSASIIVPVFVYEQGRFAIFKVHLKPIKMEDNMEAMARRLAALTPGFSGESECPSTCDNKLLSLCS